MADMIKQFLPKGGSDAVDQLSEMLAEALGLPIDSAAWIVIAGVSLVTLLFAVFLFRTLFGSGEKKAKRGTDLVLLGHCNAGKTCLFYQLKAQTFPETVSSLEVKEEEFPLQGLKKEAVVKVVDFPGHARLRGELPKYLKSARGILFLVDATAASSQSVMRETADLLYDILTGCIRARNEPKVMVICNKHDDSKAASSEVIKAALEKEMYVSSISFYVCYHSVMLVIHC